MYELKTKASTKTIEEVIEGIPNVRKQEDARQLIEIFSAATKEPPVVWGEKAIGFGSYQYEYASGHSGQIYKTGFIVNKDKISLHMNVYLEHPQIQELLQKLGKIKTGKSCVYINKLSDINLDILSELISITDERAVV